MLINRTLELCLLSAALCTMAACQKQDTPAAAAPAALVVDSSALQSFGVDVSGLAAGGNCSLDAVNGLPAGEGAVAAGDTVVFGGWVADVGGQVPTDAKLVLTGPDGQHALPVSPNVERPDVAQALNKPELARAGFNVSTVLAIAPGTYSLHIVMGGESPVACPISAQLLVGGP